MGSMIQFKEGTSHKHSDLAARLNPVKPQPPRVPPASPPIYLRVVVVSTFIVR